MNYKFYREVIGTTGTIILGIMPEEEKINVLFRFGDSGWTPSKAQSIIDGVKSTIDTDEEYSWANEDVHLLSDKNAVFLWDLMSMRGGGSKVKEKQDLDLPHEEFISFMEDFKKFVEQNG